jgi:hypothetical protein
MTALNAQQIASLLQKEGVSKEKIPTMTAIALAESSGRPQAFNPRGLDRSYGLFQVNMYGGLGPARMKEFGLKTEKDLFNPETNIRAAKKILGSQGLSAWSVYKGGQYKQFLPEAQKAAESLGQLQAPQQPAATPAQQQQQPNNIIILADGGEKEDDKTSVGKSFLTSYLQNAFAPASGAEESMAAKMSQGLFRNMLSSISGTTASPNYFGQSNS